MNTLDIIVVAIVAISGLFAFVRGFTREALSIAAWLGAAAVAIYGAPFVQPYMHRFFAAGWLWLADIATYLVPFIVAVILFSIIVGLAAAQIRNIGLGALDRALGLLFGVARGVLLVCLAYLVMIHLLQPENTPNWVMEARSRPLLAAGAEQIQQMIPRSVIERNLPGATHAADKANDALRTGDAARKLNEALDKLAAPPAPKPTQKPADPKNPEANSDSKGLDQLIQAQEPK
ncbi:MAG: rane protein required for colicin production [Aliidongia sp.]|jgi:membrane protein required for colicin V production|nr:rane protein required for colicin production [Aliidongia sp.]